QADVSATLSDSVIRYAEVARDVVEKIEATFTEFATYSERLNEIAKGTVAATKRLLDRIERIEAPSDLLEKKFDPMVEKFLAGMQQSIESYSHILAPQVEALVASMQQATEGTKAETSQTVQLRQLLEEVAKSAQKLEGHLTTLRTVDERRAVTISKEMEL